jgi:hypothetical protein
MSGSNTGRGLPLADIYADAASSWRWKISSRCTSIGLSAGLSLWLSTDSQAMLSLLKLKHLSPLPVSSLGWCVYGDRSRSRKMNLEILWTIISSEIVVRREGFWRNILYLDADV